MSDLNTIMILTWHININANTTNLISSKVIPLFADIDKTLMQQVFSADVKKDGVVAPQVDEKHLKQFKTDCGFGPGPFPSPWKSPFTTLSTRLQANGRDWLKFPNLLKSSTTSGNAETQVLNPNQYKSVGYDTGPFGPTVFAGDPEKIPPTTSTVASMLDTASTSISENKFWPPLEDPTYKDLPHILIIETDVCERLGLPNGSSIATATTINPATGKASYNFKFKATMFPGIILEDVIHAPNGPTMPPQHLNRTFKKYLIGNKAKNKEINNQTTDIEDRKKYLLFKELSDILTLLYQVIYSEVEGKKGIMLTVDSVVFYRAIFYNFPCLNSGIRKEVLPGHATYYYYEANPSIKTIDQIKDILSRCVRDTYNSTLGHNMLQMHYLTELRDALRAIKYVYLGEGLAAEQTSKVTARTLGNYHILNKGFKARSSSQSPSRHASPIRSRDSSPLMSSADLEVNIQQLLDMANHGAGLADPSAKAKFEDIRLEQLVSKCSLVDVVKPEISHQMIIENIITQIEFEIELIITNSIELIKLSMCCLGMIELSRTQQMVIDSQTSEFIPYFDFDFAFASISGSLPNGTFNKDDFDFDALIRLIRQSPDIALSLEQAKQAFDQEKIRQQLAIYMNDSASSEYNFIRKFMRVVESDIDDSFTISKAFTQQIRYINKQIDLACDNIRHNKCSQYVTVIDNMTVILLEPKLLCYKTYTYQTGDRGKRIGKDTIFSKNILDVQEVEVDDDYSGGKIKSRTHRTQSHRTRRTQSHRTQSHRIPNKKTKRNKRIKSAILRKNQLKHNQLSYRSFTDYADYEFLDVNPMCVISCKAAVMCFLYSPNIKLENERLLLEKLHILVKIFYDILVEHYPNIYILANNLISHYGFSEEEINEVGYIFSKIIQYHKTPYKLYNQTVQKVFRTQIPVTRLITSIGGRYKNIEQSKKVKQVINVKKAKQAITDIAPVKISGGKTRRTRRTRRKKYE